MIDTIIFDLSEVCINGLVGVEDLIASRVDQASMHVWRHLRGQKLIDLFQGNITEEDYWMQVIEDGGYTVSVHYLKQTIRSNFTEFADNACSVVRDLTREGRKVHLLSDHAKEWVDYIENVHDFLQLFTEKYYSFQNGQVKLGTEAFRLTLKRTGANPETTLFIDDSYRNLQVASQAGIAHTYRFSSGKALRRELTNYGLL